MSMDLGSNISILGFLLGYLAGSVPFGLLLTSAFGYGDIRQTGSGNIGATNVLRTGNKGLAAATLLADILKGALPAFIGSHYGPETAMLAGLGAFFGHLFPVWLNFRGGKGVATYIGVLIGLYWPFALVFCGVWLISSLVFRISSLSALIAAASLPIIAATSGQKNIVFVILLMSGLVFIKHKENIKRLMSGDESKIGSDR